MTKHKLTVVVVCGATATGKTDLAIQLAEHLKAEIISFDSIQVYKKLDIGAAKPTTEMLKRVRHHLISEVEPESLFTAGDFRRRALEEITRLKDQPYVVLVGGTGFYLQALLKGMYAIPEVSQDIKDKVQFIGETDGFAVLYDELKSRDPVYARTIHQNDRYRISRALELLRSGVRAMADLKTQFITESFDYPIKMIGLSRKRDILRKVIVARTRQMIERGLISETKKLSAEYPAGLKALQSVGYKETLDFLEGKISQVELVEQITRATLQLAKRQTTWFKRDPSITWFDTDEYKGDGLIEAVLSQAIY